MNLIEQSSGKRLVGEVELMSSIELATINESEHFHFKWRKEINHQVYSLKLSETGEVLGLISIVDYSAEFRLHIQLIESSTKYRGKNKTILNIPGCLIAYVCRLSYKKGYGGFVSLVPKTQLIDYYINNYGFIRVGTHLAVFDELSEKLINKYFGDGGI